LTLTTGAVSVRPVPLEDREPHPVEGRTEIRREAVAAADEQLDLLAERGSDRRVDESICDGVGDAEASTGRLGSVKPLGYIDGPVK